MSSNHGGCSEPWIAVFDLSVTETSPAGSCVRQEVLGLAANYDITVLADAFDIAPAQRTRWVRVPLPHRPVLLRYVLFHPLGRLALRLHIRKRGCRPILVQATQGQYVGADICYAHFCHKGYLKDRWRSQDAKGIRRLVRWLVHRYNAYFEGRAFQKARGVVTPSRGLAEELVRTYPFLAGRIEVIPSMVDVAAFARPLDFNRSAILSSLPLEGGGPVLSFVALGAFAHKGLGLVLEALARLGDQGPSLLVVGGSDDEIDEFARVARRLGVRRRVAFTGFQRDVRPFLWASDLFVLPSIMETFSLAVLQAMAAGLPAVVTRLDGVEEYAVDGENAWIVDRTAEAIAAAVSHALADPAALSLASAKAVAAASRYDTETFVRRWRDYILRMWPSAEATQVAS